MSRKVFTADEILTAADVNSFLMDQTVMSFAGTAARGSAILTPTEGMVTYLEDTDALSIYTNGQWVTNRPIMNFATSAARGSAIPSPVSGMYSHLQDSPARTEFYNGSAWVSPFGVSLIASTDFSAQSAVQVNSCFTSQFDVYKVVFNNLTIATGDPILSWQMVSGTTPVTTSTYNSQRLSAQSTTVAGSQSLNQTSGFMGFVGPTGSGPNFLSMEISNPFLAAQTKSITHNNYAPQNIEINYARHANATSYDGIRFILASSTMSGSLRIYGYRNA